MQALLIDLQYKWIDRGELLQFNLTLKYILKTNLSFLSKCRIKKLVRIARENDHGKFFVNILL
jgi:hypothetical protein